MSSHKDHEKHRRNDLKSLPSEVLLKARSTLVSLVKSKQEPQRKPSKEPKKKERLKSSRSEPDFDRNVKHRSRTDEPRDYGSPRPRPLSVGAMKRYEDEIDFHCANYKQTGLYPKETTLQKQFESSDDVCVQSRLVIPVVERLEQDVSERPRKKLSFREPEIVGSASATLGRSGKLMGVNSLTRRPNRLSRRSEMHSSLDGLDSDLESQAMKIVRTVGQAFEVCHKMQANTPENPVPSTSSAPDDVPASGRGSDQGPAPREPASESAASEAGASSSKVADEPRGTLQRPKNLDLLPPPPKKEGKRSAQPPKTVPSINLPELPECVTAVDTGSLPEGDASTPLSAQHQLQLLRERLEQQGQQTRAAVAQLLLLRDQLAAEQAARCEAQARTHQLLVHNKELLEHISALVAHLQEKEKGHSRPISAQQLTLLPQMKTGVSDAENVSVCNGNYQPLNSDALIKFIAQNNKMNQNVENNNVNLSNCCLDANAPDKLDAASSSPSFDNMTNDEIQHYLISKFQDVALTNGTDIKQSGNKYFYQNRKAFPHIPPLTNDYSNSDLADLLNQQCYVDKSSSSDDVGACAQGMSIGHSQNSLYSTSQPTTSKDSSPDSSSSDEEAPPFIMPLSHNGMLTATGEDGRVRLIVPVSPSPSAAGIAEPAEEVKSMPTGANLQVPGAAALAPAAPITRSTSEKVPNRSEMMTALRSQWTRHTTK